MILPSEQISGAGSSPTSTPPAAGATSPLVAKTASDAVGTRLGLVGAVLLGWAAVALLNAVDIALRPLHSKAAPRLAHHAIDLGHVVALALVLSGLTALWQRLAARYSGRRRFALAVVGVSVVAISAAQITLIHDLAGAVERWTDAVPSSALVRLAAALVALAIPASFVLGRVAARYRVRGVGLALGLALIAANRFILKNGYPGAHLTLAACGATLLAASACGAALGTASSGLRGLVARITAAPRRRFASRLARVAGFGLAAAFALASRGDQTAECGPRRDAGAGHARVAALAARLVRAVEGGGRHRSLCIAKLLPEASGPARPTAGVRAPAGARSDRDLHHDRCPAPRSARARKSAGGSEPPGDQGTQRLLQSGPQPWQRYAD